MANKLDISKLKNAGKNAFLDTASENRDFFSCRLEDISLNPYKVSMNLDDCRLHPLIRSIEQNGLLQPIVLWQKGNKYYILSGQRRFYAYKALNRTRIDTIVKEINETDYLRLSLEETFSKSDIHPIETATLLKKVLEQKNFSNRQELAKLIKKSQSYLTKVFSILSLEPSLFQEIATKKRVYDLDTLYELSLVKNVDMQIEIYQFLINKKIDREGIRRFNRVKSLGKVNDLVYFSKKRVVINLQKVQLTKSQEETLLYEIEQLLQKYS